MSQQVKLLSAMILVSDLHDLSKYSLTTSLELGEKKTMSHLVKNIRATVALELQPCQSV